ncbi:MAG TPA: endonuclease/exonuclease/phosphatase family protein [Cyclobacteriaceae bacterium]|nr:endonuclease/exonuclease/phosphatase family protein [Cyclobacteriaceae bacterium]
MIFIIPVIALVIGWKFMGVTFRLNEKADDVEGLSVLSYNTHLFNFHQSGKGRDLNPNSLQWVRDNPSAVKCLQEFYQDYTTPSHNSIKILTDNGKYEHAYHLVEGNPKKKSYGLAIFSKYPIINEGLVFENKKNNGAMFVDIKVDRDTVRIYNTHLESMSIRADQLGDMHGIKENYRSTLGKLKNGIQMRATQVNILSEHIQNSPYPVIIAGDFNDVPYSYTYFTLRSIMKNAFEEAGRGFGFTYNKVLFFLRIDNIFYGEGLHAKQFKTHREVDYSDHYPISSVFSLTEPR